ncbi:Autophagy-related protein 29 [Colletotrichum spinosum]|uniref:Autophagy-related protein 29 n=1 Tax=Colletotrichum spinosum TaxID=1347390 RepID=A0A4R8QQ61_9PEZI|nr:Autophagy-related protein 29 [Colletotrichum spinosum]
MTDPTYTVFVRLPILRGEFKDPPAVRWDSTKDDVLWSKLSEQKADINWPELAAQLDVTVEFLVQQVAYVNERHTAQVRAQVRKATAAAKGSAAPSPVPSGEPHSHQRTISALSIRRESPLPRNDPSTPATPITTSLRPNISRNASAGTISHNLGAGGSSSRQNKPASSRPSTETQRRRLSSLPIQNTTQSPEPASPGPDESSSPTSSDDESSPAQSRIIRRPPRFQQRDGPVDLEDDEDDDAEPAFLQYKPQSSNASAQDLGSTLRGDPRNARRTPKGKERTHHSETSDSSTSSPALVSRGPSAGERRPVGPLSPRRQAELSGKSPSSKGKGYSRDGSDGTPSMGSSFSDLDDASVTQSALEEALTSKMQDGAIGSRFSISQAFRSRYMPKPGQQ